MVVVKPLDLRSKSDHMPTGEWLSIITLCFAPLIVHIIAGIPNVVYLQEDLPAWHESMCFYNPTTIIWRYFALADRRIRSRDWNAIDMVASNVRFWAHDGWDGSEEMMERSRLLCTRAPVKPRMDFLSRTAAETVIITLQGVQAIIDLTRGFAGGWQPSLATIFYGFALFGLLRLPAAYWLTEEGSFLDFYSQSRREFRSMEAREWKLVRIKTETPKSEHKLEKEFLKLPCALYPRTNWRTWLLRLVFLGVILVLAGVSLALLSPWCPEAVAGPMSLTSFAERLFYSFLMTSMLVIISVYSFRKNSKTTIIPCIQSLWYKLYTITVYTAMLSMVIVASLETRKSPCGYYTVSSDYYPCPGGEWITSALGRDSIANEIVPWKISMGPNPKYQQCFMGIYRGWANSTSTWLKMAPFTGSCVGLYDGVGIEFQMPGRKMANSTDFMGAFKTSPGVPARNITDYYFTQVTT